MPRPPFTIPITEGPVGPWKDRVAAGVVAAAAITVTCLLASVSPDPRGIGTHERLGMTECGWPLHYGIPCPTCGCTTAACLVVHGRPFAAFATQPFGAAVAIVGLLIGAHALLCLVRARSFADLLVRLPLRRLLLVALAGLLLGWWYKYLTFVP